MHWFNPAHLSETKGFVDRFLLDPRGEPDGLLLTNGTEVHFPSYLGIQVVEMLGPGAEVTLRGVHSRNADIGSDMVDAVCVRTRTGTEIVDRGPPDAPDETVRVRVAARRAPVKIEGVVRCALHGPHGETSGALLEDGRIVRVPVHAGGMPPDMLAPGDKLSARGDSVTGPLGTVVAAREFAVTPSPLAPVDETVRIAPRTVRTI